MRNSLVVVSGLPGSGKSAIAEGLARSISIPVFSIDPVEAAMWRAGVPHETTGIAAYEVVGTLAAETLKLGQSAIVDAVSPIEAPRAMWRHIAQQHGAAMIVIECICSSEAAHRQRIEARVRDIRGMPEID